MEKVIHKSSDRGFADHGWLKARHSFSFANYHDSEKMHFGKLRVFNDDIVAPSHGFDVHPHQDMEIITIPLAGALKHGDNMGNEGVITAGEVQVMSAGTGVWHSEFNASDEDDLNLFQIWILTDKKGHKPRYDQKQFPEAERKNKWQLVASPDGRNESLMIHQNAFISLLETNELQNMVYRLNSDKNGVYFMVVNGFAEIAGISLERRDAIGVYDFTESVEVSVNANSKIVAVEVPMH